MNVRLLEHATDAQLVVMTQQYAQDRIGTEYVTHLAYVEINARVAAGQSWAKCMDCGNPFRADQHRPSESGASGAFCSEVCERAYLASM